MAKFYPTLTPALQAFIAAQQVFFVAMAPHRGRVNLSPKGMDTFRCLGDRASTHPEKSTEHRRFTGLSP